MLRPGVAALALAALVGCGGSSSAGEAATPTSPATTVVTNTQFRAAVVRLWHPLKYADPTAASAAALAAKFDGFADAVEAQSAPPSEITERAAIASAARDAADKIRTATDPVSFGGAVGAAQGTIGGLIEELPK